jgi:ubiquinone/menaquinone biosynthesis C-methylase UbiE
MDSRHDVDPAHRHAAGEESGWRVRWRTNVVQRAADVALAAAPLPLRVLDIGCGDGALLRELAIRLPNVLDLVGVDPSGQLLREAEEQAEGRAEFVRAAAEQLPFRDAYFDLVVSTMSLHHWRDQPRGLAEAARVLAAEGHLMLADQYASRLRRSDPPDTSRPRRAAVVQMLERAGLQVVQRETIRLLGPLPFVRAFIASP